MNCHLDDTPAGVDLSASGSSNPPRCVFHQEPIMNKFTLTCVLTGISLLTTACSTLDYAPYARYAVASYSYVGSPNLRAKRVVAVPNAMNLNVGDWVYVNITDCQQPLKRVDQRKMLD